MSTFFFLLDISFRFANPNHSV